jgi:predicted GIY-YIG superfamily endonuclease
MDDEIKKYWLYVLKLEADKYYVGVTSKTPEQRFRQHQNGFLSASWTKKYKPLEIFDKKELGSMTLPEAEVYENKVVREYIKKYGINNVRGGDLSYSGTLMKRFGWYRSADDWETVTVVVLLMLIILALGLMIYLR